MVNAGGLALALAADLRLAADNAVFALPPARLGLAYPIEGLRDRLHHLRLLQRVANVEDYLPRRGRFIPRRRRVGRVDGDHRRVSDRRALRRR